MTENGAILQDRPHQAGISKESLANEVKEITKEQVIREAANHVDHSRIFADTASFRDSRSTAYRNAFERYLELKQGDYSDHPDEQQLTSVYEVLLPSNLMDESASSVHLLALSLNDKNMTFHRLVSMLRDEFTFGEKGLNGYLGTRIRHGLLPGTIRTAAAKEQLLTPKTSGPERRISRNVFWEERLPSLPEDEWRQVDKALTSFTEKYEEIIAEINDEWLQIASLDQDLKNMQQGGGKAKALFDYSISALETFALQKELSEDDYEHFIRVVTGWLWRRTNRNLKKVRSELTAAAAQRFRACYSDLNAVNLSGQNAMAPVAAQAVSAILAVSQVGAEQCKPASKE
ncbi:MAG: hypothetical protein HON70_25055 [Lentisphaerae bacterium]|nr:hypothetical protein [Lentisphaerota bacterium]